MGLDEQFCIKLVPGVILLRPEIIITILAIKLYLEYKRLQERTLKISIRKENARFQYICEDHLISIQRNYKLNTRI